MSSRLPEENLCCPVCYDIFCDPVLLACSHSFCRGCLGQYWKTCGQRACPLCRTRTSKRNPPSNLALRNLCEAFVREKSERAVSGPEMLCPLHGANLELFCQTDEQPICVVCQASKLHKDHDCCPTEEAVRDCKEKLTMALRTLNDWLHKFTKNRMTSIASLEHIKIQSQLTGQRIKDEFVKLHQFLYEEEEACISDLRNEEEQKVNAMKEKNADVSEKISILSDIISTVEQEMLVEDVTFLQNYKTTLKRAQLTFQDPEGASGSLIDEARYLGNLKYKVWSKMKKVTPYSPVTLDPNTAHPCLSLSHDLTSLHYARCLEQLPCLPERFQVSAEVLGVARLRSGRHCWDVEVADSEDWIVGVATESIQRDRETLARPENGFWTLCLRDDEYRAMTSPPTPLTVAQKLEVIHVQLDLNRGLVAFSNMADGQSLHTFTHTFTESVLPYFYTQSTESIRILPQTISIAVNKDTSHRK